MRHSSLKFAVVATSTHFLGALFATTLVTAPSQAATFLCTPAFTSSVALGAPISANLSGPIPPCPAITTTVSLPNTGAAAGNSGVVFTDDRIDGPGTNNFTRSSISSVSIGANATSNPSFNLSFTQPVVDPYLFFSFFDPGTSITFGQPFVLAQANNAVASGATVTSSGTNTQADGFVVQLLGSYSAVDFTLNNQANIYNSVAFTAGIDSTPVPGPFPLLGLGVAFGFSRRLRRRIQR